MSRVATLAVGVLAAAGSAAAHRLLTGQVRSPRWQRTNHAGNPVTLLEGPAYVAGTALGALTSGPAGVVAVLGSGAFGALDDLAGDGASKGLKGHLGAAAHGRVTTGLVKIAGIGVTGLVAAALADRQRHDVSAVDTLVGGAVVAGAANLANLLDLRPGRALKVTVLAALPLLLSDDGRHRRRPPPPPVRRWVCCDPTWPAPRCSVTPAPTPPARWWAPPCSEPPAAEAACWRSSCSPG